MHLQAELHEALRRAGDAAGGTALSSPPDPGPAAAGTGGQTVLPNPIPGEVPVTGISLMRSQRAAGRLRYTELYWKELED